MRPSTCTVPLWRTCLAFVPDILLTSAVDILRVSRPTAGPAARLGHPAQCGDRSLANLSLVTSHHRFAEVFFADDVEKRRFRS
jgi:hypothetical protein